MFFVAFNGVHTLKLAISIAANAANVNLKTLALAADWDGERAVDVTVSVEPGVILSSSSTGLYTLRTGDFGPALKAMTIINPATWVGKGGAGGSASNTSSPGSGGGGGGPCFLAEDVCTLVNSGIVGGGGSGGSGGRGDFVDGVGPSYGGGGGGGAGYGPGGYPNGGSGSATSPGAGGPVGGGNSQAGGSGGGLGNGVAIQGISKVTLINTGNIYGAQQG